MSLDFDEVTQIPPEPKTENSHATTKEEIEEFARNKMEEWGLVEDGWEFHWNPRIKRAIGKCKYKCDRDRKKKIELSETWLSDIGMERLMEEGVDEDFAEDVVLHEIAHAVDIRDRGTSDHSWFWKEKARQVGADPNRTCDLPKKIVKLIATWKKVCPNCGKTQYYHKKPHSKNRYACSDCCDKHNNGKFSEEFEWEVRKNDPVI